MKIRKTTLMCLATVFGLANLVYSQDWSEQDEAQIVQSFDAGSAATKPATAPKAQATATVASTNAPTGGQPAAAAPNTTVTTSTPPANVAEERYGDTTATSANYKAAPATTAPMPQSSTASAPAQGDIIDTTVNPSANKMIAMGAQKQAHTGANEQTFSIDFPTGDIKEIIRSVADLYSLNVVIPEALIGTTSVKLSDVTWPQVFTAILQPVGYGYMEDGNIIKIKSNAEIANEPMDTRLFPLQYTTASVAAESLKPMLGEGASTFADDRTNTVVVIERPSKFKNLEMVLKRLDKEEPQIQILTQFFDVSNDFGSQMGVNFSGVLGGKSLSAQNLARSYARTKNKNNGIKADVKTSYVEGIKASDGTVAPAIFSVSDLSLVLGFLKTHTDSKLIANPSVVTMNNTEATINIAKRTPVPQYSYNQDQGVFEVSGFDYIDIGVTLKVLPKVKQDLITLSVKPELSSSGDNEFKTFSSGGGAGAEIPIINSRRADTNVTIKDGYTIMIGGLMQSDYSDVENKVPGLGNIPGIGRLFRYNTKTDKNRSVIVLLTANQIGYGGEPKQAFDKELARNIDPITRYKLGKLGVTQQELNPHSVSDEEVRQMTEIQKMRDAAALQDSQAKLKLEMEAMTQAMHKEQMDQQTNMSKQKRAQKIQKMRSK